MDLVEQMAAAKWREKRAWALETATLDYTMDEMEPRIATRFESTDQPTRAALRQLIELQRASSPTRDPGRQGREKQNLRAEPGHLHDSKKAA